MEPRSTPGVGRVARRAASVLKKGSVLGPFAPRVARCTPNPPRGILFQTGVPMPEDNLLMIDSSEDNADLYFATRFIAPDSFVFVRIRGKKYILINDLEIDRAKKQARVDAVLSTSKLARAFKAMISCERSPPE